MPVPAGSLPFNLDAIRSAPRSADGRGAMPGFVEMTREEKIGFFLAPLLTVVAFALLGGIIHLLWIAFAGGSADPLRQPLVDRTGR